MSTPKASSSTGRGPKSNPDGHPHDGSCNVADVATGPASPLSFVELTQHPIQNLPSLLEILRPAAAARIAAAARVVRVHENNSATTEMAVGQPSQPVSTWGASDPSFSADNSLASRLPPPPSREAVEPSATAKHSERTAAPPTPPSSVPVADGTPQRPAETAATHYDPEVPLCATTTVPPVSLVIKCVAQLCDLLTQWHASNEGDRRRSPQLIAPPPLPSHGPHPGRDQRSELPPVPTITVGGAVHPRRSIGKFPESLRNTAVSPAAYSSAHTILQMLELILWYCLSTAERARLTSGGRSHGTSGFATPGYPGGATGATRGGVHPATVGGSSTPFGPRGGDSGARSGSTSTLGGGGRAGSAARSGNCSAHPMAAQDWLGSRMSSTSSTATAPACVMEEDQLAELLFRPVVDAVVLFQTGSANSGIGWPAPTRVGEPGSRSEGKEALTLDLQIMSLWTLAAVLVRFADASFNAAAFLPLLFPQVDVRGAAGATVRHPLLQPLLRGCESITSLRSSAAAVVTALLHKLRPTLQYAEEPQQKRPTAFLSLASQCGTALSSLHESLSWGLEQWQPNVEKAPWILPSPPSSTATPLLYTYATVVAVTPYNRCPRSKAALLHTLQLAVVHSFLAHDEASTYASATVLVTNIFQNESMRCAAAQLLATAGTPLWKEDKHTALYAANNSDGGALPAGTTTTTTPVCSLADSFAAPANAVREGRTGAGNFLSALLSHADTRAEVWRCMVPLSRLYPRLVQGEFEKLMNASAKLVATLTEWEASEEAAARAAVVVVADTASSSSGGAAFQDRWRQLAPTATTAIEKEPSRAPVAGDEHTGSHGAHVDAAPQPPLPSPSHSHRIRSPAAFSEAFAECLRTWLHFMGYVWKAFDDNAKDPAQQPEGQRDRATLEQKRRIHEELLRPAMRLRRSGELVRTMTLRCIAQIGNDYISTIPDRALCEEMMSYVQASAADGQSCVRSEALTTLGVWLWQYVSLDDFACAAIDSAVHSVITDPDPQARAKAAFALSNVTGRLPEGSCHVVRDAPEYIATLCATAMHAVVIDTDSSVQGHGIRMMNQLLQVLTFDELISEVVEFEEGVAEGFLRVLLECLRARTRGAPPARTAYGGAESGKGESGASISQYTVPREAKHRWNAACALGMGLARKEVFEAEPKYSVEAVDALCTAVVRDHIFKVRTQAAIAIGRIPGSCLGGKYSSTDLTPMAVESLCKALETATSTENFKQYREQGALRDALRSALTTMMTTSAASSNELGKVFAKYGQLLQAEALL